MLHLPINYGIVSNVIIVINNNSNHINFRYFISSNPSVYPLFSIATLPPVSTSDRIVFKSENLNETLKEQIKYSFFLIETNGTIEDTCEFLKERFDKLYPTHEWVCAEGATKVTKDIGDYPFALFEYLPPGLGFSIKGVYISYDGTLKSASTYLLLSRVSKIACKESKQAIEDVKLKVFFFNTPYFLAIFMSIAATVIIWRKPVIDLPQS